MLERDERSVTAFDAAAVCIVEMRDHELVRERKWRLGHDYRSTRTSTERGLSPYVLPVINSSDPTSLKLPLLSSKALVSPARYHALPGAGGGSVAVTNPDQ